MRKILIIVLVAIGSASIAQNDSTVAVQKTILTLDECLKIAMDNNIQLKRTKNEALISKAYDFQALMNFLPSVNASANYRWNNGSGFDNSSGQFFTGRYQNSFPGLQASLTVFNGLNNVNYKKSTAKSLEASANLIMAQEQDVQSSVLGSYLSVVLDKENIKISQDRVELLQAQLEREERRHTVGVGNLDQVYNFKSQLANENLRLVNLQNQLLSDMLILLQVLQLEVSRNFDVAPYQFQDEADLMNKEQFQDVLESSLSYSPGLRSAEANAESALYNWKSTKGQLSPTLNLVGQYGTQYSSNNADENGQIPIEDQYQNLTYKNLDLQLFIPIFNNLQSNTRAQVARLSMENAKLGVEQTELDVTNTVQRVYLDLISAQETYKAAQENLVALNQSFEFVKTRYENGAIDFYSYLESLNNKNRGEIELVNAKYSIVFRKKILDVYRGLL